MSEVPIVLLPQRSDTGPALSVVITTKDRKDELREAIKTTLAQTVPVDLYVLDDGSSDGTREMVLAEFPGVRVERVEPSLGIIRARNYAIARALCPIVVTIDDDCVFPSTRTIEQTLADFDHPRIGAVAIPSIDVRIRPHVHGAAPDRDHIWIASEFRGGANAMRRDLFLSLGGYFGLLWRQGEEGDFGARLLEAGYVVRLGRADPLHHLESPRREHGLIYRYSARNSLLFAWHNVPMPQFLVHVTGTTFNVLRHGLRRGFLWPSLSGIFAAIWTMLTHVGDRRPVSRATYRLIRQIKKQGPWRLEQLGDRLRPMARTPL